MATQLDEMFQHDSDAIISAISEWLESKRPRKTAPPQAEHDTEDPFDGGYPQQQEPQQQRSAAPQRGGYAERPPSSRNQPTRRGGKPATPKQLACLESLRKQNKIDAYDRNISAKAAFDIIKRALGND